MTHDERHAPTHDEADGLAALTREERHIYERVSRRAFLGTTAAGTLAALAGSEPTRVRAQTAPPRRATADAVIELWMAGGMAQTETFDPKRYTPYAAGTPNTASSTR